MYLLYKYQQITYTAAFCRPLLDSSLLRSDQYYYLDAAMEDPCQLTLYVVLL